jgi:hypothetical protein
MYGVVANVKSDSILRLGAKVWILDSHGMSDVCKVRGCSIGGRVVKKYIPYKRLETFRAAWIPEHMRARFGHWHVHQTKEAAAEQAASLNEMWSGIRFFSKDGKLLQDGAPESQSLKRFLQSNL